MADIRRSSGNFSNKSGSVLRGSRTTTLPLATPSIIPKSGSVVSESPYYENVAQQGISPEGAEARDESGQSVYSPDRTGTDGLGERRNGVRTSTGSSSGHPYPNNKFSPEKNSKEQIWGLHPSVYGEPADSGPESGQVSAQGYAQSLVVDIFPALPKFGGSGQERGLQIFSLELEKGVKRWHGILSQLSEYIDDPNPPAPLRLAVLNDVSVAEQWGHTFGETTFEGMMNFGSKALQELKGISGHTTIRGMLGEARDKNSGYLSQIAGGAMGALDQMTNFVNNFSGSNKNILSSAAQLLEGSKVDFPTIWQGSQFSPQYQLTCRLYNPDPTSPKLFKRFILTPLAYILAFACPTADSKFTYTFPLIIKARCAGLFYLPAGFISSVQVVKGGDSMDLTYQQQPGEIDVRITLDSLYETMVASAPDQEGDTQNETISGSTELEDDVDRPTLKKYFGNLWDWQNFDQLGKEGSSTGQIESAGSGGSVDSITSGLTRSLSESSIPRVGTVIEDLSDTLGTSLSSLGDIFTSSLDGISSVVDSMKSLTGMNDGFYSGVTDFLNDSVGGIDSIISGVTSPITGISEEFTEPSNTGIINTLGTMNQNISSNFGVVNNFDSLTSLPTLPKLGTLTTSLDLTSFDLLDMFDFTDRIFDHGISTANYDDSVLAGVSSFAQGMIQNGTAPLPTLNSMFNSVSSINNGMNDINGSISDCLQCCSDNIVLDSSNVNDSSDLSNWINDSVIDSIISLVGTIIISMNLDDVDASSIQSSANSMLAGLRSTTATQQGALTTFKQSLTG